MATIDLMLEGKMLGFRPWPLSRMATAGRNKVLNVGSLQFATSFI
jgi:hypothetical protein